MHTEKDVRDNLISVHMENDVRDNLISVHMENDVRDNGDDDDYDRRLY